MRGVSRHERIEAALRQSFDVQHVAIENESHKHSVKPGSETHFKVLVVSDAFSGKSRVVRHRTVNEALARELSAGLHALSIRALTIEEWNADGTQGFESPECLGGSKKH